jgi:26S proteasome regulatory subunit N6
MPESASPSIAELEAKVASQATDTDSLVAKEEAIHLLSEHYAETAQADKLVALVAALRPFFAVVAKAKTAKIVRTLIDQLAKIPNTLPLQMQL